MDFGSLLDHQKLDKIRWSLSSFDSEEEKIQLARLARAAARTSSPAQIHVGVPVWNESAWVGSLYPPKTKALNFLKEYSKQFSTVELNSTFYSIPTEAIFSRWNSVLPASFRICPKFPQTITHQSQAEVANADLGLFAQRVKIFEAKLGVCFLQLPATVGPESRGKLEMLFAKIPKELKTVVEFRNENFFYRRRLKPEWIEILATHRLGTVINDTPLLREISHGSLSSTRLMIRFLGSNLYRTDYERLDQWVEHLRIWIEKGLKEVYFIVHQPDNLLSPQITGDFIQKLNAIFRQHHLEVQVQAPQFYGEEQIALDF